MAPTLTLESATVLTTAKRFFQGKLTEADLPEYPEIETGKLCTIADADRRRKYGDNKEAVTMKHAIVENTITLIRKQLKNPKASLVKASVCFVIYMMQKTKLDTGVTIYDRFVVNSSDLQKHEVQDYMFKLCNAIYYKDEEEFMSCLQHHIKDIPKSSFVRAIDAIKDKIKAGDFNFPMQDYFMIYDEERKKKFASIYAVHDADIRPFVEEYLKSINELLKYEMLYTLKHDGKINGTFEQVIKQHENNLTSVARVVKAIRKQKFKEFTISEFFDDGISSSAHEEVLEDEDLIGIMFEFLQSRGLIDQNEKDINSNKRQVVDEVLGYINTSGVCIEGKEDYDGTSFDNYTFDDIDGFLDYDGYCFSVLQLANLVMSQKGLVVVQNVTFSRQFKAQLPHKIALYFSNHYADLKYDFQALKMSFDANFESEKTNELVINLETKFNTALASAKPQNARQPQNVATSRVYAAWKAFYTELMTTYADRVIIDSVRSVYELSCNTVFELTGLLGYMCLADDISIFDNDGQYFHTSEYCKELYKHFYHSEISELEIKQKLQMISFNNKSFDDLVKGLDAGTCIHGIGCSFIRYYLNAYEAGQQVLPLIKGEWESFKLYRLEKLIREHNEFVQAINDWIDQDTTLQDKSKKLSVLQNNKDLILQTVQENITKIETIKNEQLSSLFLNDMKTVYLEGFKQILADMSTTKRENTIRKVKPLPEENEQELKDMFKLAPFIIEAPEEIRKKTDIAYLTCVMMDKSMAQHLTTNPNNFSLLVFGYTTSPTTFQKCMYIRSQNYKTYLNYEFVDNFFEFKDSNYNYTNNPQRFDIEGFYDYKHRHVFRQFFSDPKNSHYIRKLAQIPNLFHKQRQQTFRVFKDYSLNVCQVMNAKTSVQQTNTSGRKASALANVATQKFLDVITLEENQIAPRFLTVIKTQGDREELKPFQNMHMWNSGFNNANANAAKASAENPKGYYIDSLQNFLTLPYVITENGPQIKSPYGGTAYFTKQYQIATLLAKVLIHKEERESTDYKEKVLEQYSYFESYFKLVNEQDSTLRNYLFQNIEDDYEASTKEAEEIRRKGKIDTISVVLFFNEIKDAELRVAVLKRMQVIIGAFYAAFFVAHLNASNHFKQAVRHFKNTRADMVTCVNYNINAQNYRQFVDKIFLVYVKLLDDYVKALCYEGLADHTMQYHFTELGKEYYLLSYMYQETKNKGNLPLQNISNHQFYSLRDYDQKTELVPVLEKQLPMVEMINILNEYYSYFDKDQDLHLKDILTGDKMTPNLHAESIPRAIEYLIKIQLISQHKIRAQAALTPFEKIIDLLTMGKVSSIKKALQKDIEDKQDAFTVLKSSLNTLQKAPNSKNKSKEIEELAKHISRSKAILESAQDKLPSFHKVVESLYGKDHMTMSDIFLDAMREAIVNNNGAEAPIQDIYFKLDDYVNYH